MYDPLVLEGIAAAEEKNQEEEQRKQELECDDIKERIIEKQRKLHENIHSTIQFKRLLKRN